MNWIPLGAYGVLTILAHIVLTYLAWRLTRPRRYRLRWEVGSAVHSMEVVFRYGFIVRLFGRSVARRYGWRFIEATVLT